MITFEQARTIVAEAEKPTWDNGTYVTLDWGYENDQEFCVLAGCKEALIDHDPEFWQFDAPTRFVEKATGKLIYRDPYMSANEVGTLLQSMLLVGNHG